MIVITYVDRLPRIVLPGDSFRLTISDAFESKVIIEEEIIVNKTIDFIASYRFAREDGSCEGFHLSGIFGIYNELPQEMKNAKYFEQLTPIQQINFRSSVGTEIKERV